MKKLKLFIMLSAILYCGLIFGSPPFEVAGQKSFIEIEQSVEIDFAFVSECENESDFVEVYFMKQNDILFTEIVKDKEFKIYCSYEIDKNLTRKQIKNFIKQKHKTFDCMHFKTVSNLNDFSFIMQEPSIKLILKKQRTINSSFFGFDNNKLALLKEKKQQKDFFSARLSVENYKKVYFN